MHCMMARWASHKCCTQHCTSKASTVVYYENSIKEMLTGAF
jgi:hypothetical protein